MREERGRDREQGCQMAYFQTKNTGYILESYAMEDVGTFYGHLVYFMAIWYSLWSFGIFCGHLVYFMVIWYIFSPLRCVVPR
jgi:hypothetical protein